MKLPIKIYVHKILYFIAKQTYYVGFISISNGTIGTDAVGLPVLFTDCAKVITSGGVLSYLRDD